MKHRRMRVGPGMGCLIFEFGDNWPLGFCDINKFCMPPNSERDGGLHANSSFHDIRGPTPVYFGLMHVSGGIPHLGPQGMLCSSSAAPWITRVPLP